VESIQLVIELLTGWQQVCGIGRGVIPPTIQYLESCAYSSRPARNVTTGTYRHHAMPVVEVQELTLDGR
jgi:hypothetical protein